MATNNTENPSDRRTEGSLERVVSLDDVKPDGCYVVMLLCAQCSGELNSTHELSGKQVVDSWARIAMGSAFAAGGCKNGCRATFSDLNINTRLSIVEANNQAHAPATKNL